MSLIGAGFATEEKKRPLSPAGVFAEAMAV
jgi:hypothetical protein